MRPRKRSYRAVDSRYNAAKLEQAAPNSAVGTNTLSLDVTNVSRNRDYLYARIGVKTKGVEELIYTTIRKIELQ
jgi:hypothetical protein